MSVATSTQRQLPAVTILSPLDDAAIQKFAEITTKAFDPPYLLRAFYCEQDNIPPPYPVEITWARRLEHFVPGIITLIKHGAIAVHAGDWSAMAIWQPPGYNGPSFGGSKKQQTSLMIELGQKLTAIEHRLLAVGHDNNVADQQMTSSNEKPTLRPSWHLAFLARNPDTPAVPGAVSAVVLPFLERARNEKVPICLEATTLYSVEMYKHYGFRVVDKVTVGMGKNNAEGWPEVGGPGVSMWAMIYDAHLTN